MTNHNVSTKADFEFETQETLSIPSRNFKKMRIYVLLILNKIFKIRNEIWLGYDELKRTGDFALAYQLAKVTDRTKNFYLASYRMYEHVWKESRFEFKKMSRASDWKMSLIFGFHAECTVRG